MKALKFVFAVVIALAGTAGRPLPKTIRAAPFA